MFFDFEFDYIIEKTKYKHQRKNILNSYVKRFTRRLIKKELIF